MLFNVSIYVLITHSSNVSNCQGQMRDPSTKRRIFSSVSALGRAGTSVLDSVEALSDLLLVAGTEAEHTAAANVTKGTNYVITEEYTGIIYTRARGRQMIFKISSDQIGTTWQLGAPRIDIKADGRR